LSHEFPRRPKIAKGAIVALRPNARGKIIDSNTIAFMFQYNPETLTRTISSLNSDQVSQEKGKNQDSNTIIELINLTLDFDATDQLELPNQHQEFVKNGLHPTLSTLESIMYSQSKIENPTPPIILFLWGSNRIIPVSLDRLNITEEAFDANLNPIRVKIDLNMRVQKLSEFKRGSSGYTVCASHYDHKRIFARLYRDIKNNSEMFEQLSFTIQKYLALEKSRSKKRTEKGVHT